MELIRLPKLPDLFESLAPRVDADTLERIEVLWERERAKGGAPLFDGMILSLLERRDGRWVSAFVPNRHWVAQRRSEPLGALLRIQPITVSALLLCHDGLVFGRRSAGTQPAPGTWELAPSGSIDPRARVGARRVSAQAQLFLELEDELGIRGMDVRVMRPFATVERAAQRSCEIVFEVEVPLSFARVRAAWAATRRGDYSELRCCAVETIETLCGELGSDLLTGTRRVLAARGWLPGPGFSEEDSDSAKVRDRSGVVPASSKPPEPRESDTPQNPVGGGSTSRVPR